MCGPPGSPCEPLSSARCAQLGEGLSLRPARRPVLPFLRQARLCLSDRGHCVLHGGRDGHCTPPVLTTEFPMHTRNCPLAHIQPGEIVAGRRGSLSSDRSPPTPSTTKAFCVDAADRRTLSPSPQQGGRACTQGPPPGTPQSRDPRPGPSGKPGCNNRRGGVHLKEGGSGMG